MPHKVSRSFSVPLNLNALHPKQSELQALTTHRLHCSSFFWITFLDPDYKSPKGTTTEPMGKLLKPLTVDREGVVQGLLPRPNLESTTYRALL